jgi:hypothetical protein
MLLLKSSYQLTGMNGKKQSATFLSMHCSLGIIERVSSKLLLSFCYPSFIHDNQLHIKGAKELWLSNLEL